MVVIPLLYIALFIVLAVIDFKYRIIPNKVLLPVAVFSLALSFFRPSFALAGPGEAVIGGIIFFLPMLLMAAIFPKGVGWGDVKMAAVVGIVIGYPYMVIAMMSTFIAAAVAAVIIWVKTRKLKGKDMPYAPFLSLGAIVSILWGPALMKWFLALAGQ